MGLFHGIGSLWSLLCFLYVLVLKQGSLFHASPTSCHYQAYIINGAHGGFSTIRRRAASICQVSVMLGTLLERRTYKCPSFLLAAAGQLLLKVHIPLGIRLKVRAPFGEQGWINAVNAKTALHEQPETVVIEATCDAAPTPPNTWSVAPIIKNQSTCSWFAS